MDNDTWKWAVFRWKAYCGLIVLPDGPANHQAERDRERYGPEYYDAYEKTAYNPFRLLRFVTEICGLTYAEAWEHLTGDSHESLPFHGGSNPTPATVEQMLGGTGNVLECLWLARFYADMAVRRNDTEAAKAWEGLIPIFQNHRLTALNVGAES